MNIEKYGFSGKFSALALMFEGLCPGRVISQEKNIYRVVTEKGERLAEVSGKFRYNTQAVSDYPAVGDFVMLDMNEQGTRAVIHSVLDRKSCFVRRAAGESRHEQIVAANIDIAFICMSLNNDYNIRRLERYLSVAWDSGATPVIVLTKSDLCTDLDKKVSEVKSVSLGVDVLVTTFADASGYNQVRTYISDGTTAAFIGSSGVGKSTLINYLLGENRFGTNGLRNDGKGRHTTTHRELVLLPDGGMVIDTPGMRELGIWSAETGIDSTFADIEKLAKLCRFKNCTHSGEDGCAVADAINSGVISEKRRQSYDKLKAETAYISDSASYIAAKEKKFKSISKINKKRYKK